MTTYTHILDLAKDAEPPADGILSRTVFQDDRIKAVVFGFGQGQELSEHTAAKPAMLFFVKGQATVVLDEDVQEAQAGTWVHMPANLKHSIKAKTPVVMLWGVRFHGDVSHASATIPATLHHTEFQNPSWR